MVFQQFNLVKRSSVMTNVLSGRLGYANPWLSMLGHLAAEREAARHAVPSSEWASPTRRTAAPMRSPAASSSVWALRAP